jgi:hypothetical protein
MPEAAQPGKPKRSSQQGFVIWHGMRIGEMLELFAHRPPLHLSRWNRIGLLPGMACYNSLFGALENLVYGRRLQQTQLTAPPIFVLGFWRSGTTLLHSLLARDPQFTSPTMYQTLFPWHFLLTESTVSRWTESLLPKTRPMDNVPVSWSAPQEDDVALCIMSLVSPYMFLATPGNYHQYWRSLDFTRLSVAEKERWQAALQLLLTKITLRTNKRIVLKSPSHTFRIPTLLEMFPDAKFVYIYRNPYKVFRSAVHLRQTMVEENGLGKPCFDQTEEEVIRSYRVGFETYERDRKLIPAGNLQEIRFEDLEQDPLKQLQQVYQQLQLPGFENLQAALQPELPSIQRYQKNQFKFDPVWMDRVYRELLPAFQRFGYRSPFEELETAAA